MDKYVVYNGKGNGLDNTKVLAQGKMYEIVLETIYREYKTVRLKGLPGEYDASLFDAVKIVRKVDEAKNKPAYLAKATLYRKDISLYIGYTMRLKKLDNNKLKEIQTARIEKIEHICGDIYKFETLNAIYITEVTKRTVA